MFPYIILNTFWICFYFTVQQVPLLGPYFSNPDKYVAGWKIFDYIDAYVGYMGYPLLYPLWFVRDLFFMNLLAVVIKKLIDRFPKTIFVILSTIWIFNIPTYIFCMHDSALCFWMGCTTSISSDKVKRFLIFISQYSFSIYLFHESNLTILKKVMCQVFADNTYILVHTVYRHSSIHYSMLYFV